MQNEIKALTYEAIMQGCFSGFSNFDSSTVSERINTQQFICNETCVNIISQLATLKFRLITLLANMMKYQIKRRPCCVLQQLRLREFLLIGNIPEIIFDYVIIKWETSFLFPG